MKKDKILFVAKDMGGFEAILPVLRKIKKNNQFDVFVILENPSYKVAKNLGIKSISADGLLNVGILLDKINPKIILLATSSSEKSIDKKIIVGAKRRKILTISMVDFWSNHNQRFGNNWEYLPDYILAIDKKMKDDMVLLGIPENRIYITGSPRFEGLAGFKKNKENKNLVVFYSQPFSEEKHNSFNEITVFGDILEIFEKHFSDKKIIIKFHPKEKNLKKFDKIIKKSKIKIEIEKKLDAQHLSVKSGLICGINSIVLFDASLMGKKVLSYQPGQKKSSDPLVSNIFGWSSAVYNKKHLFKEIKNIYKENKNNNVEVKKYINSKSTDKIIDFMEKNMQKKNIICVVQARTGSSRLPKKVLFDLEGKPVLLRVVDRLLKAKKIDHVIVATTTKRRDNAIVKVIDGYHPRVSIFRGSENDVLDRFYNAVKDLKPKGIIRITADCPLIDPDIVDEVIDDFLKFKVDYVSNTLGKRTYPRGLDVEIFSFELLQELWKETIWETDREHVTLFARRSPTLFNCRSILNNKDYSSYRWTLDEASDYKLIKIIYKNLFHKNENFRMNDVIDLFKKDSNLVKINKNVEQKDPHF